MKTTMRKHRPFYTFVKVFYPIIRKHIIDVSNPVMARAMRRIFASFNQMFSQITTPQGASLRWVLYRTRVKIAFF